MAALIPLLLPQIIDAGVNIGIGITNAIQGDSSTVSLQIGRKVFTNKKKFNFGSLPPELRSRIILMAMEASKDLIRPMPYFFDPMMPPTADQMREMNRQHPLNPKSKNYRSIVGERLSANGYPLSTWRWATLSVEWSEVMRPVLWRRLEVLGRRPYVQLVARIESKGSFMVLKHVHSITLREGFRSAGDIYTILLSPLLGNLEEVMFIPDYPTPFHQLISPVPHFQFGLQLLRTTKPMKTLVYGFPLETTTNPSSRQQLKALHPSKLQLTTYAPYTKLFEELKDLVAETTDVLILRYVPFRSLVLPGLFLCDHLQSFKRIHLHLWLPRPRMILTGPDGHRTLAEDPESPVTIFITNLQIEMENATVEVQERYRIYKAEGWDTAGQVHQATKTRIWPKDVLFNEDFDAEDAEVLHKGASAEYDEDEGELEQEEETEKKYWERETDLKLFGGLVNLKLESKKH